ncbi:MAG: patatin-like phospholipase family protein [Spirochaetales bacterium]|uniref:Patatin-like phospholipase family protein n=1 Tax=Candidatus Thalassospirochaeta sargassi TaxID=3119039 RepID=A0AAJ1MID4_9SPIO|nr:patatin-like phospholipase family protein [Spirochaetales bacterium]
MLIKKIILFLLLLNSAVINIHASNDEPVAVVLSGGGARGAYQIGVWKAMIDIGVDIQAVYGVSVGAINGAIMTFGDYETARELWLALDKDSVMNVNDSAKNVITGDFSFADLFKAASGIYKSGGIDVSPLESLLRKHIDEDGVRDSDIKFGLAAYSLTDHKQKFYYIEDIPPGGLVDYILASSNFPLFQRKVISGEEFIDGGVHKNLVIEMVDPEAFGKAVLIALDANTIYDFADRVSGYSDYCLQVQLISPGDDLGTMLDFSPDNSLRLMRLGYLDGLKAFGLVSGRRYYIYGEDSLQAIYLKLSPDERAEAAGLLEVEIDNDFDFSDGESSFQRFIQPEFSSHPRKYSAFLEFFAASRDIPRDRLYSEAELLYEITDNYIHRNDYGIYYDKHLDFISYLALRSDRIEYSDEVFHHRYLRSYNDFLE